MKQVLVVGSGASAVQFALSVLEKGYRVVMLDVGHARPDPVNPTDSFADLKRTLPDPIRYFLGERFETVRYPDDRGEYYGFPPSKDYVFSPVPQFRVDATGFAPLSSFARGGLAETWTGGVYPFNDHELSNFPLSYDELAPYYDLVSRRIGVTGEADDLARFMPVHDALLEPLDLDEHADLLLRTYRARRELMNRRLGCYLGRSRVATISRDLHDRAACGYLGRCLWGCPTDSLYTPSVTLRQCRRYDTFHYVDGVYVTHFAFDRARRITSVTAESVKTHAEQTFDVETLVLAAGTLSSCKIVLESVWRQTGEIVVLPGLMDNRQILMPFVNPAMLCKPYDPRSYQFHQLSIGFDGRTPKEYIHGQITTLKTALVHSIVHGVPVDLRTALHVFQHAHAALGLVNINLHDIRRDDSFLTLDVDRATSTTRLVVQYVAPATEPERIRRATRRVRRALRALGCIAVPFMTHVREMGASAHYAGPLPMSTDRTTWTTSRYGQSHDFPNLFIVDGTILPFLPAKNVTFTLMANAARIADCAFA